MKPVNSFFSFVVPLIVMLVVFSIYLLMDKVVTKYQQNIVNDYSIVVVTNTPFVKIKSIAGMDIKNIEILHREKIIKGIEGKLSKSSLKMLETRLPYFYKIYLTQFPTTIKLEQIRKELNTISNVKNVETFSANHNKVYSVLILVQDVIVVFLMVVLILSFLLLAKQIKLWFYEHKERIDIIQLHGGSIMYASKPIIKLVILSAIISSVVVWGLVFGFITNISKFVQPEIIDLIPKMLDFQFEIIQIVVLSFLIPFITFFWLLGKYKLQ